ncbi:MAG: matrixin family metalloprotease [Hyphomicrobiaceae bacterium]
MPFATDYTTLLSGSFWTGADVMGEPVIVTYSFLTAKPATDVHGAGASVLSSFAAFTAQQQQDARDAMAAWSAVSGIIFQEVPAGKGDINLAGYNFSSGPFADAGGVGFFPWGNWNYSTATASTIRFAADVQANGYGDVMMNTAFLDGSGRFSMPTMIHEIGHALGLKHPTEPFSSYSIAYNEWDPAVTYDGNFSIMSPGSYSSTVTTPTAADIQAIRAIYGDETQKAAQFASWSWNSATATLTGTLKNGGQTVRGVSTSNTLYGGTGGDAIYAIGQGTNGIYGKGGNDTLVGGSGTNYLDGGAGADELNGWFSSSTYASYYDAGPAGVTVNLLSPWLNTGDAAGDSYLQIHKVIGSGYADTIVADNAGDVIFGRAGNDTITGGTGTDFLYGEAGIDTLYAGSGLSYLDGGAGGDSLVGVAGAQSYASYFDATGPVTVNLLNTGANTGDAAGDSYTNIHRVLGSGYGDTIVADHAGDIIYGRAGNDTITGGNGSDTLYGEAGNDSLVAGLSTDFLDGGAGADRLVGLVGSSSYAVYFSSPTAITLNLLNRAADTGDAVGDTFTNINRFQGSNYADTLVASNSGVIFFGRNGDDTIVGGTGADSFYGQAGNDSMTGGLGNDQFLFNSALSSTLNVDTITDFSNSTGNNDIIRLDDAIFLGAVNSGGSILASQFVANAGGIANATSLVIYDTSTGALYFDRDANGGAYGRVPFAVLIGAPTLTSAGFSVF